MNCCTGGTPGSRRRGWVHSPTRKSKSTGMLRQASTKKNWSLNGQVSKYSHRVRSATEFCVLVRVKSAATSAFSSLASTNVDTPCPAK